MELRRITLISIVAVLFIISSHLWLDREIAGFFGELLARENLLSKYASNLPDLLLPVSFIFTITSWVVYSRLDHKGKASPCLSFFHLTGWTVPAAFLAKAILKDIFGGINTRYWLLHREQFGFHWFTTRCDFSGFPSGHMLVFTVITLALWRYFPRLRHVGTVFLVMLAAALIITDYHFLSDVVAGALLAVLVDASVFNLLFRKKDKRTPM